jgi:predicted phosphodiesterase
MNILTELKKAGSISELSRQTGLDRGTIRRRIADAKATGATGFERSKNAKRTEDEMKQDLLDLKKHGNPRQMAIALGISNAGAQSRIKKATQMLPDFAEQNKPSEAVTTVRRLQDRLSQSESQRKAAERFAAHDESIREAAFGLAATPLTPPSWNPPASRVHSAETMIMFLSDVHMGEVVDLGAMSGRNSYNSEIATNRLRRYFTESANLIKKYQINKEPECLYLVLGGDLITGEIHEELAKTNDLMSLGAVKQAADCIVAGIEHLRAEFPKLMINVVSVPGNHGRLTKKPEHKQFALDSYDTLIAWMVERWFSAIKAKNITFSAPLSGDAMVNIYGYNFLFTHGDRIGSRGGTGFIGTPATATKGMKKLVEDFISERTMIDYIIMGHFHTPLMLEYGYVNSSLIGPNEYGRSARFKAHPAAQWLLSVHPNRGVAQQWLVRCGDPSEGSIYKKRNAP